MYPKLLSLHKSVRSKGKSDIKLNCATKPAMALVFLRLGCTVAGSRSLAVALSITIAIGVFPVGNFVLNPLERAYSAQPVVTQPAGILVLGGAEGQAPDYAGGLPMVNDTGDRLIVAMQLAQ